LTGPVEGVRGLVAEKFGPFVVLQLRGEGLGVSDRLMDIAREYRRVTGCKAVYLKRFPKTRTSTNEESIAELRSPVPLLGRTVPSRVVITEWGLRFEVRPYDGFSVGLYLDHRENRSRVRALSGGRDVLNLFAYTCAFSVAAAAGGAASVTSVDISPANLEWGRNNFALNEFDTKCHRFFVADAADYLKRAERKGESFGLIILDPPTFAHGRRRKRFFSALRDLSDVVSRAVSVLKPDGILLISTNHRQMSMSDLQEKLKAGAAGRRYEVIATPRLPLDFSADPDHAKTIFVRFGGTVP